MKWTPSVSNNQSFTDKVKASHYKCVNPLSSLIICMKCCYELIAVMAYSLCNFCQIKLKALI